MGILSKNICTIVIYSAILLIDIFRIVIGYVTLYYSTTFSYHNPTGFVSDYIELIAIMETGTYTEMKNIILKFAMSEDHFRVAGMNGSRVNQNAKKIYFRILIASIL